MIKKKILICDDNIDILEMLELILTDLGYIVICEKSSLNVKSILDQEELDLVIIDLWMPILSGDQLVKMMRENMYYTNIPVIIISASLEGRKIAETAGATDFLSKPFDYDELINCIEENLLKKN